MRTHTKVIQHFHFIAALFGAAMLVLSGSGAAGTLYVGADVEDFAGGFPTAGKDRLGVVTTAGATVVSSSIIPLDFLLNGLADADGKLLAGTPLANPLNTVAFDGTLLNTISAPGIPVGSCCNEEMLFVPQAGGGSKFYHAHYSTGAIGGIREIDPTTGALIGSLSPQTDVVGMALINGEIWITRWGAREIGKWDPSTNNFTVEFDLDLLGLGSLGNAGALAWDPFDEILWLGTSGGRITPFSLTGTKLGDSYLPFGTMSQTIDGLTFRGEVTRVPEPGTIALLGMGMVLLFAGRRRPAK